MARTNVRKEDTEHEAYITTTFGMSGYFAVMYWWNPESGGFWEPYNTGFGRYKTKEKAVEEAKQWAEAEDLQYKP